MKVAKLLSAVALAATILIAVGARANAEPAVRDILAKLNKSYDKMTDLRAEINTAFADESELVKISEDFARSFGFKKTLVLFKPPDKLRYESSHTSFAKVVFINNGETKLVQIPSLHLGRKSQIQKGQLGKKQYPIDFGIACGDLLTDWSFALLRSDSTDGHACYVMKLTNPSEAKGSYMELWVDRSLWIPRRLDRYHGDGRLKCRTCFTQFKLVGKYVLIPHRVDVYNSDSRLAGALEYTKAEINLGTPDSLFKVK